MIKTSYRSQMDVFHVMHTLATANAMERTGKTIYRFEAGQPAFPAPKIVSKTAADYVMGGQVPYTDPIGLPVLRQAICKRYQHRYGIHIDISRIMITAGASGAFSLAFLSCFEAGDRVALAMPCYPSYKRILQTFGVEVVPIMATEADKYHPTLALLDGAMQQGKLDGLILASPSNPTGTTLTTQQKKDLVAYCKNHHIRVISDELYHGVEFTDKKSITACAIDDNAFVINSFSKYFCMTGWRLGWVVVPENMIATVNNLNANLFICASTISQYAGVKVFECTQELERNIDRYRQNRDVFVTRLIQMGIDKFAYPEGGFYIYADISHLTQDSVAFCDALLKQGHVSASPGLDFDPYRGHTTLRLSYVCDTDHAKAGLDAFEKFIATYDGI